MNPVGHNPIPHHPIPRSYESSRMRSPRDGDAVARQWVKHKPLENHTGWLVQNVQQVQRQLNRLRLRRGSSDSEPAVGQFFPFRIYQCPGITLAQQVDNYPETVSVADGGSSPNPTEDVSWRLYRVRAGKVGGVDVTVTDGIEDYLPSATYALDDRVDYQGYVYSSLQAGNSGHTPGSSPTWWELVGASYLENPFVDPDNANEPPYDDEVDYLVEAGETWSFWIDCTDMDAPHVAAGVDAPAEGWGANYVWLGTVDCATYEADAVSVVRQIRREDVPVVWGCVDGEARWIPV